MLVNKTYVLNPTLAIREKQLVCELLFIFFNSSIEYQRFYALNLWAIRYQMLSPSNGQTLTAFLDKILLNARKFTPLNNYTILNVNVNNQENLTITCFQKGPQTSFRNSSNLTLTAIDSPLLRIDLRRLVFQNNTRLISSMTWVNITFRIAKPKPSVVYLNLTRQSELNFNNG